MWRISFSSQRLHRDKAAAADRFCAARLTGGAARPILKRMPFGQPLLPTLLRIACRSVLRHRRRSLITFSAVFLALSVMVSIRGLLNGLQASLREEVVLGQTGALQVHRAGFLKSVSASLELDLPVHTQRDLLGDNSNRRREQRSGLRLRS